MLQAEKETEYITKDLTTSPVPLNPKLEEVGTHWGVRTPDTCNTCTVCGLSLVSLVSERQPGLVTFICGKFIGFPMLYPM